MAILPGTAYTVAGVWTQCNRTDSDDNRRRDWRKGLTSPKHRLTPTTHSCNAEFYLSLRLYRPYPGALPAAHSGAPIGLPPYMRDRWRARLPCYSLGRRDRPHSTMVASL